MNAPLIRSKISVRSLRLDDSHECVRIDAWIMAHSESTPFHRPAWLTAIAKATGQEAICLIAESANGDIMGMLPLHAVSSMIFGKALVSSGFAVGGGILSADPEATRQLIAACEQLAEKKSCPSIELRGGDLPRDADNKNWILKSDAHANFVLPIVQDSDAQWTAIPRKKRAEIRKGIDNALTIEVGRTQRDLDWHYQIYAASVRNLGTPVFPKSLMAETLKAFGDDADILTILSDGKPVASVFSLYHKGAVMPYWGGGNWEARHLRANDFMYFALINHARERGCDAFDFGRSKTGSGAYSFKKTWGIVPEPMTYAIRTADGSEPRDVNPNSPKYKMKIAIWQKLPLPIANFFGPMISKGLG